MDVGSFQEPCLARYERIDCSGKKEVLDKNPQWNMPYVPAIKVLSGKSLYISGVNAAPIYHSHPHQSKEFNQLDFSPDEQAKLTMENLKSILYSAGGEFSDIVQLFIFIVDPKKIRFLVILPEKF